VVVVVMMRVRVMVVMVVRADHDVNRCGDRRGGDAQGERGSAERR
jgi:hypothetical protein